MRSSVIQEVLLKCNGSWPCMCNYLAFLIGRKQSRAQQREWQPPGGLLSALLCVRHEAAPQQIDKSLFEESGWAMAAAEARTFLYNWIFLACSFSPRTARKIKVVLISSNMKKKRRLYHAIPLLYWLMERKKNFFWSHTRRTMSVSHFEFKTPAQGKGNQTCHSSVQAHVGAHTWCLILPRNAFCRVHPIQTGVEPVCSDTVLSHFSNTLSLSQ